MKKLLLSLCLLSLVFCIDAFAASSPVVQVVSYKEPLGLYFSLQGWGSGSIVDKQGHIITNNHVVDDGFGGISDNFAVCITDNPALPPRCHYTASVIDRDVEADIAVLRLDATDIFGKSVDVNTLSTLIMDMDYTPESGDTVVARGYPWVGANTITETQGIISGTAQYNGNTYIKTDTLIAGGNSGGPLIYDDVLVGINTFLMGGGYDPSLGYSLLISEVQDFLSSAFSKTKELQSNSAGFASFLKKIDTFSVQNNISDPLVTFDLTEEYTIESYIPSMSLQAHLSDGVSTAVTSFGFYHMVTPRISDEKTLKNYIFGQFSLGEDEGYGFRPVTIGGRTFYEVIETESPEDEKLKSDYGYISMLDETHMMVIFFSTPSPTKNTLEKIQKTVQDFLGSISFPSQFVFPNIKNIVIPGGNIRLNVLNNSSVSYDIDEYEGVLSYHIQNREDFVMVRNYLGNFWNKAEISVFQNSFETEDDSIDTWLKNTTESMYIDPVVKRKVSYQGHQGFLVCTEDMITDESGKSNESIRCETILLVGEESEYIVSTQMILPKKQLKAIDTLMVEYLKKSLQIPVLGDTAFIPQGLEKLLPYSDVSNQSMAFQKVLGTLIGYGILQSRPLFEGDVPLRWREYFSLFTWSVYHKRMNDLTDVNNPKSPTFEKVFSVLPVVMNDYAEDQEWRLDILNNVIRLLVAGGSLPRYDYETMSEFSYAEYDNESIYKDSWNQIITFESTFFPRSMPMQSAKYTPSKIVTYSPFTGLEIQPQSTSLGTDFFRNTLQEKIDIEQAIRCDSSSVVYFSAQCRERRKESLLDFLKYPVLTKGKAIENILEHINPSFWKDDGSKTE